MLNIDVYDIPRSMGTPINMYSILSEKYPIVNVVYNIAKEAKVSGGDVSLSSSEVVNPAVNLHVNM